MLQRPAAEASSRRPGRTGRTQLKLFNAAMEIMTEKGLEYATVEEVAARAGVSKGTVYYTSVLRRPWWISWFSTARSCC